MEPKTEQSTMEQVRSTTFAEHPNKMTNKTKWMIAGGVVLLLAIAAIVWRVYVKHRMLTPSETLQQLEATSQPVTATPQEKQEELDSLKKQSTPPTTTVDIRQQMLGKLH